MPVIVALIVLGIVAYIIYLYILFVQWMLAGPAPELLVLGALLGMLAVPVLYGNSAYQLFGGRGSRDVFWIPIVVLLGLVYCDFASIFLGVFWRAGGHSEFAFVVGQVVEVFQSEMWGNAHLFRAGQAILPGPEFWAFPAFFSVVVKCVLIVVLLIGSRGLENDYPDKKQPAFRQYFFGRAQTDLQELIADTTKSFAALYSNMGAGVNRFLASVDGAVIGWSIALLWPLLLALAVAVAIPSVFAAINLGVVLLVHSLALGVVMAFSAGVALLLFLIERSILLVRSGYAKCPHAGCHQRVPLPAYQCPKCGVKHDNLIPGRCGVFRRACKCGQQVSTFSWFGKRKLQAFCPQCDQSMLEGLFTANVHVPIYGGPSSGKTMFMIANTWKLLEDHLEGTSAALIDGNQSRTYSSNWKPDFESGRVAVKTAARLPDAVLMSLRRAHGLPVSLYMYDPAGEALENEDDMGRQRYLEYFDSLAVLIDPFSLPAMAAAYQEQGGSLPSATSQTPAEEVVQRIVGALETQAGLSRTKQYGRRIAVIVTKGDAPFVQEQLGVALSADVDPVGWSKGQREDSDRIRAWFERNQPAFLQLVETHFSELRFFLVSAMGHEETPRRPFEPKRALEPLVWLLSARKSLRWPFGTRLATRFAEVAVVTALLAVFVTVPYLSAAIALPAISETHERWVTERAEWRERARQLEEARRLAARPPPRESPPVTAVPPAPRGPDFVVVTPSLANVRSLPSMKGSVVTQVKRGTRMEILGTQGGWYRVRLSPPNQNRTAWIYKSVVDAPRGG